jgi:16S rRNA (guanine527-N7)-methyltransferase
MKSEFYSAVEDIFTANLLPVTPEQAGLFEQFYELMLEKNNVTNLTRITAPAEAAQKHFFDSVSVLKYVDIIQNATVMDIGSGAGFPGIPLKIIRPDIRLTLLDSSAKKIGFVRDAAKKTGLHAEAVCARAEELAAQKPFREGFDIVLSRAVASLPVLLELCIPFVKKGGLFVAYKGADYETELNESKNAIRQLNIDIEDIFLPYTDRSHALIVFRKLAITPPIYPRKFATIKKKHL